MVKKEIIEYQDVDKKNLTAKITKIEFSNEAISEWQPTISKPHQNTENNPNNKDDEKDNSNPTIICQYQVESVIKYKTSVHEILGVS